MTKIIHLAPHDPIPDGPERRVLVLRRFEEDDPRKIAISIILSGDRSETVHPVHPDGKPLSFEEAIHAAQRVAESEHVPQVLVLDRTQGRREQEILRRGGDHSAGKAKLDDSDWEDGERGPDMRDRK